MAKIQRKTQKIFAGGTTADQITAFGTAKTTNPVYTTDLDAIQTNTYTQGWTPSLMSDLAPYLQDSNALWYLVTTQLAYLFQQGIAEWDAGTEYTQGSIVSRYNNGELEFYMSLQNGNTNHQLTETGYWKKYDFNDKMNKDFSNATSQPWNDRLKIDLSNATSTSKANIIGWVAPDYSKSTGINLQNGQVLGFNGWLSINLAATGANQGGGVYINNVLVASFASGSTSGIPDNTTSVVIVSENDVITWNANGNIYYVKIPFKGV